MQKSELEIVQQTPELIKDINLFKLILTPLELFVLKYFIKNIRPTNVREVYTHSLLLIFNFIFGYNTSPEKRYDVYELFIQNLIGAGYGGGLIDNQTRNKVYKEVYGKKGIISDSELDRKFYEVIRKYKGRTPSYEKIKGIFKRFETIGIIYKRSKEGKIVYYGLNPTFYNIFKDKFQEILKL